MGLSQGKPAMTACVEPARGNICAIVVTYFPDAHFGERLGKIKQQVAYTLIVDNTGEANPSVLLQTLDCTDAEIIRNKENLGIGEALNQGMARAIQLGFPWTITFDQDSWVRPELVETLIDIYRQQLRPETVGIIGCNFEDASTQTLSVRFSRQKPIFRDVIAVITSGSLLPSAACADVGTFRSDFFIDFVDHEYCLRLLKSGYKVISSTAPLMVHALGGGNLINLDLGVGKLPIVLTKRSPLRRYYMTRNGLIVAKNYFTVAPWWIIKNMMSLLPFAIIKIPWDGESKWRKFRATLHGAYDGLRGKTGKAAAIWLYLSP